MANLYGLWPAQRLTQLRREMDQLMSGFLGTPDGFWRGSAKPQPALNVWEEAEAVHVEAELPGIKQSQLEISVAGGELTLRVQGEEMPQDGVTFHRRERPVGAMSRVVRLPFEVDADHIQAQLRDGVLSITLPKAAAAKPRKITVSTG